MKIIFTTFKDCYFETDTEQMIGCSETELVRYLKGIYTNHERFINRFINVKKNIFLNGYPDEKIIGLKEVNEIDYDKTIILFERITEMYIQIKELENNEKSIEILKNQIDALQKTYQYFNDYVNNGKLYQPVTWYLIIANLIMDFNFSEEESGYIEELAQQYESFEVFYKGSKEITLSTDQLSKMKNDLEIHLSDLELELDKKEIDEKSNENNLIVKSL